MLERLREDPLRALIYLETMAALSSFVVDLVMAIGHINGAPADPRSLFVFSLLYALATMAVFWCPHVPHRRFTVVVIAILSVGILGVNHTAATTPVILLLILGTRLTFAFGLRGAVIAWILTIVVLVLGDLDVIVQKPTTTNLIQALFVIIVFGLVATLLFGLIAIMWLYARKAAATAATSERTRIALDLHDSLGHTLTTLNVHLQNAISLYDVNVDESRQYLKRAEQLASGALDDVRETVTILHDEDLDRSPLAQLLEQLRVDFSSARSTNLQWEVRLECEPQGRVAMGVYRIVQEALTNIIRHAHAEDASVRIAADNQSVEVHVSDNGCGFSNEHRDGHGLMSMRNRVESFSGTLVIESGEGTGTRIDITFPMSARP